MRHGERFLACVLLLLTACGSSTDESLSADSPPPLDAFFGSSGGTDSTFNAFLLDFEYSVSACMANAGFEYIAFVSDTTTDAGGDISDAEFAETFGYGISTTSEQGLSLLAENPNNAHILGLPEVEGRAYVVQLYGQQIGNAVADDEPFNPLVQVPIEEQGCTGQALTENGGSELWEGFALFGAKFNSYQETISEDPAVVVATDAWVECMAGNGYSYHTTEEPREEISTQFRALVAPHAETFASLDQGQIDRLIHDNDETIVPDLDVVALSELQLLEVRVATSDHECYSEHLAAEREPRQRAIEQQLLDEEREMLTELRDLVGS